MSNTYTCMETVNIIGGGIGGLTLANALQKEEIDFNLFEKAPRITEVGAAISISKAALDILGKLGLAEHVLNAGYETQHFHISDKNLKVIRATTTQSPVTIIHRAKLVDILVSELPEDKIHLNAKLTGIINGKGSSELSFSDQRKLESKCTAIADGIHSSARRQVFPGIKVRYAGQAIWRGITKINWPEQFRHTYTEIWSDARRFLFVPMDSENIFWLAIKGAAIGGEDDPGTIRGELIHEFKDFHPFVRELLLHSSNFIRSDLADLGINKRKWYQDNVVFLGDSIHATTPNLAQGGCQAIEDAYCLSLLMKNSKNDFSEVFPRYQQMRERKVSFIINTSWRFGKLAKSRNSSFLARYLFKYLPDSAVVRLERKLNDLSYLG